VGKPLPNLSEFSARLGATYELSDDGQRVIGIVTLEKAQEGPPFHVHGGVLGALIDEAMGAACWASGRRVLSVNLNFNYRHAVPLGVPLRIEGRVDRQEGRKTFTIGLIHLPDGKAAVEGTGIFLDVPQWFGDMKNPYQRDVI
jgi:acyl-coenzyme A thioesterase PaaI-like protein